MPIPRLADTDTRLLELLAAGVALWWALILLLPLEAFAEAPSLMVMRQLAPDGFWAFGFGLQGLGQGLSVWLPVYPLRLLCALTAALLWLVVALLMLLTNPPLPGGGIYLLLALGCVWAVARGPGDGG